VALTGYLVDTSALARVGHPAVRDRIEVLATTRPLYRCGIVELEVLRSATSPKDYERRRADLAAGYIDLPVTPEVIAEALDTQRRLARTSEHRGASLPDLIIAASARHGGAAVLHYDADYDLIAKVTGQPAEWVVPSGTV
jgi:predicted nucleic acid-binding protein